MTSTRDTSGTGTGAWQNLLATPDEVDIGADEVEIEGAVPEGLVGTLYRNGPSGRDRADHFFDGDGMISAVRFGADGAVTARTRYVRTPAYHARRAGRKPRLAGTQRPGGMIANALRTPANQANINVIAHAGSLLALFEGGHPFRVEPDTLETIGETDFDGALGRTMSYSAHPCWDAATGDIYNFGISYAGRRPTLGTFRLDRSGRIESVRSMPLPEAYMNHAFALTATYMVFCFGPARYGVFSMLSGRTSLFDSMSWDPNGATLVVLVPRDGGEPRIMETDPWFQFHFAGAFDAGSDVVVDLVAYRGWDEIAARVSNPPGGISELESKLTRVRIDAHDRVRHDVVSDTTMEFPIVDPTKMTGCYDTIYAATAPDASQPFFHALACVDVESGKVREFDFGPGRFVSEGLFVPEERGASTGYVVAHDFDPERRTTDVVVLRSDAIEDGPVCRAKLPANLGITFHGQWRPARV